MIAYNTNSNITARRFLPNGNLTGGDSDVASTANTEQLPVVAALPGGGFAVVFKDTTAGLIKLRLFDAAGIATGAAVDVSNASANHFNPAIEVLANGGFVVTWQDNSQTPPDTDSFAIRAQLFSPVGAEVGGEFIVNTLIAGNQAGPSVQALADGGFAITYGSNGDIRGQIFDAFGARVGTEFLINTNTAGAEQNPTMALLADGRIVVTWGDQSLLEGVGLSFGIRMQIIDPRDGVVTGSNIGETLFGHENFSDEINGLGGNDVLLGLNGNDSLYAGEGNDTLDGGAGDDLLFGGFGNDVFVLGSGNDAVQDDGGTDTVTSTISRSLAGSPTIENLILLGTAIDAIGNGLANTLTGNAAANTLNGLAGADTMRGLGGNDTYVVDNALDTVDETGGSGFDTIVSNINFSLSPSAHFIGTVERLVLTGTALIGVGSALNNVLVGSASANNLNGLGGNDTLTGGFGNDILTGGTGNDVIVFNTALSGAANRDIVKDFSHVDDTFQLENAIFTKLTAAGPLSPAFFRAGAVALDANDHIVYNQANGVLAYDVNGNGAGGATAFAVLVNKPALAANDFVVI